MADDEVIINLQGDTTTTQVTKVEPGGAESVDLNDDGGDPVADLKKQFTAMSSQLSAVAKTTQQRLDDTQQRLQRAEGQVVTSQLDTVENGIAATEAEARGAEQAYATAFEAGDGPAMARAQRLIARYETQLQRLTEARQDLQEQAKAKPADQQQGRQQPSQARQTTDPVEHLAGSMTPKSAAWIRAHPEVATDPRAYNRMLAAHNLAIADDVAVESDEYFKRIEDGIKVKKVAQADPKPTNGTGDGRRPSSAAAAGGGTGGGLNGGATSVKLTTREAASATDGTLVWNYDDPTGQKRWVKGDPIGLAEMARRKHEGQKQGLYDKNSFEA
jgi:hypothetical protein